MAIPLVVYLDFFGEYFGSYSTLVGIVVAVAAIVAATFAFRYSRSLSVRTYSLISMMGVSSFLWIFVISSLLLCTFMADEYWRSPGATIAFVLRLSLLITLAGGPSLILLFRGRAISKVYNLIQESAIPLRYLRASSNSPREEISKVENESQPVYERSLRIFAGLREKTFVSGAKSSHKPISLNLLDAEAEGKILPESIAVDWRDLRMVAIKQSVASLLEDDELEGVLAHELGHLELKDARAKSIATGFRTSFPFDPVVYFAEAAVYRERELAADEFSARLTNRPAVLASALLKIYTYMREDTSSGTLKAPFGISFLLSNFKKRAGAGTKGGRSRKPLKGKSGKLLSKQPPLKQRIERLLEMTNSISQIDAK